MSLRTPRPSNEGPGVRQVSRSVQGWEKATEFFPVISGFTQLLGTPSCPGRLGA